MDKRSFLKSLGGLLALSVTPMHLLSKKSEEFFSFFSEQKFTNDIWKDVRQDYELSTDFINLESGFYCMLPKPILENYLENIRKVNFLHTYYKRKIMADDKVKIIKKLSEFVGCSPEEVIVTRNTTESIDTVISGIDWQKEDEIIYAAQEYPAMIAMIQQVARRYGVKPVEIQIPFNPQSDEEILKLYQTKITKKTRLILVSHIINITGHVLPVKKICEMAHQRNVEVIVDGAHAIGHIDFQISDLGCDYYASSLHKWLSVPLGAGLLYVRKEHIPKIWPLLADNEYPKEDIRKLNHTGTQPFAVQLTIPFAIDYLNKIGLKNKEQRLKTLKFHWYKKLWALQHPNLIYNSPISEERSCGIGTIGVKNIAPTELADILFKEYKIWTVGIDFAGVNGVRVTPNIYNTLEEMEALQTAILRIANSRR